MSNKVMEFINSNPMIAFEVLANMYHNKCYVAYTDNYDEIKIEKISKTKRSIDTYIKKQSDSSYYDEYQQKLVSYNSGLKLLEVSEFSIIDLMMKR